MSKIFSLIAATVFVTATFYGEQMNNGRDANACPAPCAPAKVECSKPCPKPCPAPKCSPCPTKSCAPCVENVACECLERGMALPFESTCFMPAYNAPANILLKDCPWGFDAWASFIYWNISQEGMYAARKFPTSTAYGSLVSPDFAYKPGFKVGVGFNTDYDDWTAALEYTWMHQKTDHTSSTDASAPFQALNWSIPNILSGDSTSVKTDWRMHFDRLDLTFARPYYQGKRLTMTPFAGLRGQWIRQSYAIGFEGGSIFAEEVTRSHSWAVGPVAGVNTHWLMCWGFRFEGVAAGSVVYTNYSHVHQNETLGVSSKSSRISNLGYLRPTAELGVGLGWGSYIGCQNYYVDLSARYDFNVLWNQNVMAEFVNAMNGVPGTTGNLYMHGLTLTLLFAF